MKILLPLIILCLLTTTLLAQKNYRIMGSVVDTAGNVKLKNTTIAVLSAKIRFYRSLHVLPKMDHLRLAAYPKAISSY